MTTRSNVFIAGAGVVVLAAAAIVTFGVVGCGTNVSTSALIESNIKSPGVYINAVNGFSENFGAAVRAVNPTC